MKRWPAWLRDHWFLGMIGIVLLVLLLTVSAQIFLWASIPYRGYGASYAMIDVPEGTAAARAIEILEEHGVIQRSPLALVYLRLTGRTHGLKAGEYSFTRPMTPGEVFDKLISGDVYYHRVTILEGLRSDEVFAQFVRSGFGAEEEYREAFRGGACPNRRAHRACDPANRKDPRSYGRPVRACSLPAHGLRGKEPRPNLEL